MSGNKYDDLCCPLRCNRDAVDRKCIKEQCAWWVVIEEIDDKTVEELCAIEALTLMLGR